jgi:hypothetical protein
MSGAQLSDEELLDSFYNCDPDSLDDLADRYHQLLMQVVHLLLAARTGSHTIQLSEWDASDRVDNVWAEVFLGKSGWGERFQGRGSVLAWLLWLTGREVDRHLGYV